MTEHRTAADKDRRAALRRVALVAVLLGVILLALYASLHDLPARLRARHATTLEVTLVDFRNDEEPDAVLRDTPAARRAIDAINWRRELGPTGACIPWQWRVRLLDDDGREVAHLMVSANGHYTVNEDNGSLYQAPGQPLLRALRTHTTPGAASTRR